MNHIINIKATKYITVQVDAETAEEASHIALNHVRAHFPIARIIDITDADFVDLTQGKPELLNETV